MGLVSAIPTAIAGLLADLNTVAAGYAGDQSIAVVDGEMPTNVPPRFIQVGDVDNWKQEPASIGNRRVDESFDIEAVINWYDGGGGDGSGVEAAAVRSSAFGVLDAIVNAVTADWTLGGAVRLAMVMGGPAMSQGVANIGGWEVQVPFTVQCQVQLER